VVGQLLLAPHYDLGDYNIWAMPSQRASVPCQFLGAKWHLTSAF
jgi:hypothetical protein